MNTSSYTTWLHRSCLPRIFQHDHIPVVRPSPPDVTLPSPQLGARGRENRASGYQHNRRRPSANSLSRPNNHIIAARTKMAAPTTSPAAVQASDSGAETRNQNRSDRWCYCCCIQTKRDTSIRTLSATGDCLYNGHRPSTH